jgi:hypothetical protein
MDQITLFLIVATLAASALFLRWLSEGRFIALQEARKEIDILR